jgi:hypothetical protein
MSITNQQRKSLHLYLSQVAHVANNQGLTLQDMVKVMKKLEVKPNTVNLKEVFVKPYIQSAYGIDSTNKLDSVQITETYDALNKLFGFYWDISLPFPSNEPENHLLASLELRKKLDL